MRRERKGNWKGNEEKRARRMKKGIGKRKERVTERMETRMKKRGNVRKKSGDNMEGLMEKGKTEKKFL